MEKQIILVPAPGASHLSTAVEFAKLLIATDCRLSVTVLLLKFPFESASNPTAESLSSFYNSQRISFVDLPKDNSPADSTPLYFFGPFYDTQKPHVREAVRKKISSGESVQIVGFVLDMFCTAMIDVADEFGVPSYVFFTSGTGLLCLAASHLLDENNNCTEFDDGLTVPGFSNPVPKKAFPSMLLNKASVPTYKKIFRGIAKCKGVLVNTFEDLEPGMINVLSSHDQFPRVYPVGPIVKSSPGDSDDKKAVEIMEWLDGQVTSSVVFLCFGGMGSFGGDQVREIAVALERSGVRFLWSLRQPGQKDNTNTTILFPKPTEYENPADVLPEGFVERTVGVGKVVGWAPQVAVLAHPAVGGFVSHCGWNSVLESVWFGVPIAAWPLYAEQHLNALEMVKELGLAAEITLDTRQNLYTDDGDVAVVKAEEVERGIVKVMESDSEIRRRVKEMSYKSRKSLLPGGASYSSLSNFITQLMEFHV